MVRQGRRRSMVLRRAHGQLELQQLVVVVGVPLVPPLLPVAVRVLRQARVLLLLGVAVLGVELGV